MAEEGEGAGTARCVNVHICIASDGDRGESVYDVRTYMHEG